MKPAEFRARSRGTPGGFTRGPACGIRSERSPVSSADREYGQRSEYDRQVAGWPLPPRVSAYQIDRFDPSQDDHEGQQQRQLAGSTASMTGRPEQTDAHRDVERRHLVTDVRLSGDSARKPAVGMEEPVKEELGSTHNQLRATGDDQDRQQPPDPAAGPWHGHPRHHGSRDVGKRPESVKPASPGEVLGRSLPCRAWRAGRQVCLQALEDDAGIFAVQARRDRFSGFHAFHVCQVVRIGVEVPGKSARLYVFRTSWVGAL